MKSVNPIPFLSIVIPCYNESDRLELMFGGVERFMGLWGNRLEIIIVNDGSKDNFYQLAQQHPVYLNNQDKIILVDQENTGKGGALKKGVLLASGDYVLTLDADMAAPPDELFTWFDLLDGRLQPDTIYIGSREHEDSVITKQNNRQVMGNIFNQIVRGLTSLKIRDTQCGFKLYPVPVAKRLFGELKAYGWAHDVELLYRATRARIAIREMPLVWKAIEGSKIRLVRDSFNMMIETVKIIIAVRF